jgi:hypothetical protein
VIEMDELVKMLDFINAQMTELSEDFELNGTSLTYPDYHSKIVSFEIMKTYIETRINEIDAEMAEYYSELEQDRILEQQELEDFAQDQDAFTYDYFEPLDNNY